VFRTMRRATYTDSALDPRLIQPILDAGVQTACYQLPSKHRPRDEGFLDRLQLSYVRLFGCDVASIGAR